ncbi:MAG: PmbA/TldA family metallopeptidase, partial [Chloroflexota bacterium]
MNDQIVDALQGHDADYVEARFEHGDSTSISYRDGVLEGVDRTCFGGGSVRAFVRGGWGFVTFDDVHDLRDRATLAVSQARLSSGQPLSLPESATVTDSVEVRVGHDATRVPLEHKKALLDEYNDIMLRTGNVRNARIDYHDAWKRTLFASSSGHYIEQTRPDLSLRLTAIARRDNEVQQAGLSLGSGGDFSAVEGRHDQVRDLAKRASALLSAGQVKGGEYTVIVDPVLA